MLIAHYTHRLPADHDIAALRKRAEERGAVWDSMAQLHFKAFLLREKGRFGAIANSFSSLYLWQRDAAFRDWLVRGGYRIVTESFGRASIETFIALEASRGQAGEARFLYRDDIGISPDANLTAAFDAEIDRARQNAACPGMVATIVGLDPKNWTFVRVALSSDEPDENHTGVVYQIAHLSQPLLAALPEG